MHIPAGHSIQSAIQKHRLAPPTLTDAAEQLVELQRRFELTGDRERVLLARDIIQKAQTGEFVLAFCGHFSAGKSTMINELIGAGLLPSNPVPTSANVVKVRAGEAYASVTFKERGTVMFPYPYDVQAIQAYCTDGDTVDAVEISHPTDRLPAGVAILDTPGIDSTDDAHRVAAESRLHTADVVLYMMDYNHVQSRLNREFVMDLLNNNKDVWLVVNQIDKHVAFEIEFAEFSDQVRASFAEFGVAEDRVFFTTVRESDHPHNELPRLAAELGAMIHGRQMRVRETVWAEAYRLAYGHFAWRAGQQQAERARLAHILGNDYGLSESELSRMLSDVQEKEAALAGEAERFEKECLAQLDLLFRNANLMPYHTRELARAFVESRQLSFRTGRWFSGRRTQVERERRLARFHKEVCDNAATYIDIHLKKMLFAYYEAYGIDSEALRRAVYDLRVEITPEFLAGLVHKGALFTHEYMLRFGSVVVDAVRGQYAQAVRAQLDQALVLLTQGRAVRAEQMHMQRADLERKQEACAELRAMESGQQRAWDEMMGILQKESEPTHTEEAVDERTAFVGTVGASRTQQTSRVNIGVYMATSRSESIEEQDGVEESGQVADDLEEAARLLEGVSGFAEIVRSMRERAARMKKRTFTIALFGAFSAGKSSFANALLGNTVLPVSPHPTTAAINYVQMPDADHPHGTVVVRFKQAEQIIHDLNQALALSERRVTTVPEMMELLAEHEAYLRYQAEQAVRMRIEGEKQKDGNEDGKEKPHDPLELLQDEQLFFLRAVRDGYGEMDGMLGSERTIEMSGLAPFVADERRSCFVEDVRLYYESELTRQGIILVDTPGAGSMNTRHTDVAFSHIKQADAVVFVTYYNHAFSRADREFLIQLGRVKDQFVRDKMFFIINAADLAASPDEIGDVLAHVEKNLLQCGIRDARLYPVSSQTALLARKQATGLSGEEVALYRKRIGLLPNAPLPDEAYGLLFSGLALFEQAFQRFIVGGLRDAARQAAYAEISRAADLLGGWVRQSRADEQERQHQLEAARQAAAAVPLVAAELETDIERRLVEQEIEELLYYVKQRVFYRYFDEFKVIFNIPAFSDETEEMSVLLRRYTNEMIRFVAFDLSQEMRATSLRIERFLGRTGEKLYRRLEKKMQEYDDACKIGEYQLADYKAPVLEEGLRDLNATTLLDLLAPYKDRTAFFTEDGCMELRDKLEMRLREPVSLYVEACEDEMKRVYGSAFDAEIKRLTARAVREACLYFEGKAHLPGQAGQADRLEEIYDSLRKLGR